MTACPMFAPTRLYGEPDDFRRFVDVAHASGLGVILDVVYNHLGPDGNYLGQFSPAYFSRRHKTEWGDAINYDDESSGPVREFFSCNAGLLDRGISSRRPANLISTPDVFDDSPEHILADMSRRARAAAGGRSIVLIAENEKASTDETGSSRWIRADMAWTGSGTTIFIMRRWWRSTVSGTSITLIIQGPRKNSYLG